MEKRVISRESLANLFAKDEIQAASLLRDALMEVKLKVGNITDPDIKNYNTLDVKYRLDMSLTTVKNYSSKYNYGIFNVSGEGCVVKQISVNDYEKIKMKLDTKNENQWKTVMETNKKLTVKEELAINFITKSDDYKAQTGIAIRCATSVQSKLDNFYKTYSMFPKQYLFSFLLDFALTAMEKDDEKNND